ncbi:MAG: GntR family transcriptional regulator [Nocardioidaceae bacterium]|nr:GntR family transcriptional regulator [Nocardioidaceae bacterium]
MSDPGTVSRSESLLESAPVFSVAAGPPAYQQIEQWLTELMTAGTLTPGDKLPREADLATTLGVSRMTLRQALAALETRGVVERTPGRNGGTFIVEPTIECDITGLAGFTEQLRRGQVRASARVVRAEQHPASAKVARALGLSRAGEVFEVVRVRRARGQPLALERSYLPADLFPGLLDKRLTGSLYSRMARDYDLAPQSATEYLEPFVAGEEVARLLGVPTGSALLRIERTAASAAGRPIEYASDLFRPDRIRITVRTVAGSHGFLRAASGASPIA